MFRAIVHQRDDAVAPLAPGARRMTFFINGESNRKA
jgi:hypothetical protein